MSRVYFAQELETVATFWRIERRDGVALGFTSHDCDLWFDGLLHRAAPGMVPSAIRRNAGLEADSAEVEGALTHEAIAACDLAAGRFDGAHVAIGVVDWDNLDHAVLYRGEIGAISREEARFTTELHSAKAALGIDPVPRTSPSCRAQFCGPGCTLNAAAFTREAALLAVEDSRVAFVGGPSGAAMVDGSLRWLDGPHTGMVATVTGSEDGWLLLDTVPDPAPAPGTRALLREGCDHTIATCGERFGNAANFQGEPFLPGNDLLTRYPVSSS